MTAWLPCEHPGRFEDADPDTDPGALDLMSITFCWFSCSPCHDAAVELRRRQAVRPETHETFPQAWTAITRVIEQTSPTNTVEALLAAQARERQARFDAVMAELEADRG